MTGKDNFGGYTVVSDEMRRKREDEAKAGNPNWLQCDQLGGWSLQKTADDLVISKPAVVKAIKIATAIEKYPDILR